ncbi:hypothetical protein ACWDSJ_25805 [Nocardia sp. NPDC003482]
MRCTAVRAALGGALLTALVATAPAASADPLLRPGQVDNVTVGQSVSIALDGLPPNMPQVAVGQCKPRIATPGDCNLTGSLLGNADDKGVWRPMAGATVTLVADVGGVDCTAAPGACTLAVTSLVNPAQILTSVPLTFGHGATATPTPAATAAAEKSDDSDSTLPIVIGVIVAVVILAAVVGLILVRRSRSR